VTLPRHEGLVEFHHQLGERCPISSRTHDVAFLFRLFAKAADRFRSAQSLI
jgi:hypothetical protein